MNRTPRYGNDDPAADELLQRAFASFFDAVDGRPAPRDGRYHVDMRPTTCHGHIGSVTGATPDGRHHGAPLSEGISPVQGADRRGPTAFLRAAQARPEEHRGLLVRVAGYSDFFCDLGRELQDEIIARTEHAGA